LQFKGQRRTFCCGQFGKLGFDLCKAHGEDHREWF
jgi:hypothetical protein